MKTLITRNLNQRFALSFMFLTYALALVFMVNLVFALILPDTAWAKKDGWYHTVVDYTFVKEYAVIPMRDDVVIIDSRPKARKYDKGHIPGAISIPERELVKSADILPADKSTLLIFYCGGEECMLSHKSAFKAEKAGYKNIKVYASGYPDWVKNGEVVSVGAAYVKKQLDKGADITVIDSRPKKRRYDKGHIPGALSIADRSFDKNTQLLPADKTTPLIFYCGGYQCKLSSNSALKAKALGYTNVKVFAGGFPAWKKAYGAGAIAKGEAAGKAPTIKAGADEGTISIDSFEAILKANPHSIMIVDVRDVDEYKRASFKTAVNIPINDLEKKLDTLPSDKPIVFICGTGGRSGEAYDMVQMFRAELQTYFLDGMLTFNKDGSYTLKPHSA